MIDNFIEVNSLYTAKCSIAVKLKLALGSIYKGDEGPAQRCTWPVIPKTSGKTLDTNIRKIGSGMNAFDRHGMRSI